MIHDLDLCSAGKSVESIKNMHSHVKQPVKLSAAGSTSLSAPSFYWMSHSKDSSTKLNNKVNSSKAGWEEATMGVSLKFQKKSIQKWFADKKRIDIFLPPPV